MALVALALTTSVIGTEQGRATAATGKRPVPQAEKRLPAVQLPVPAAASHQQSTPPRRLARTWPAAVDAIASLPAAGSVLRRVGALPVSLASASKVARSATVHLVSHAAAARAGVDGVLFSVTASAEPNHTLAADPIPLSLSVDYRAFADAGGADYGLRLHLVQLPSCALSTPTVRSCQVQSPLPSANDATSHSVRVTKPLQVSQPMVLAAVSGPSSSNGAFTASSLSPSGSWTAGGSSGAFDWSYPIAVPPSATGADVAPKVSLSYDSSSIDGEIATSNNQSSWVGEGWDYNPGYIERTYRTCSDLSTAGTPSYTSDKCWAGQIVTMNLGGSTTSLVQDDTTGGWHVGNDSGQQVTLGTGANNGSNGGEYWKVTGLDGIIYVFGKNVLPGDVAANATNSTLLEPVYAIHSTDPCYNATFALSKCNQAWRWNLDYVIDPHGNATAYHYTKETNNYGADGGTTPVGYDRASTLTEIDYGLREISGSITAHPATDQIKFHTISRCSADVTTSACNFTTANAANYPDTPQDQDCVGLTTCNNHAPTFWSTKRLTSITTDYYNGTSTGFLVDKYDLTQTFPTAGDPQLELDNISHTGYSATGVAGPALTVGFASTLLPNRVPSTNGQPDMYFWRLTDIAPETGADIHVEYSGSDCTASTLPTDPANNTKLCFPVKWTPPAYSTPILDYFQKYLVNKVTVTPQDGRSPNQITSYSYDDTPAWHADDNEVVTPANRTYGQFRGYDKVETRSGNTGFTYNTVPDRQTLSVTTYYRGMGGSLSDSWGSFADNNEFAGMARVVETFDGDFAKPLSATVTDLDSLSTASRARTGLPALTSNIVTKPKTRVITWEPGISSSATRTTTTNDVYDSLGRLLRQTDSGSGTATLGSLNTDNVPDLCTVTSYADPVSGNTRYIKNRVAEKITSAQVCPTSGTQSPILSDVRNYYDTTNATAGIGSYGDLTRTDTRTDTGGSATPNFSKTTVSYDTAGRPVSTITHAANTDTGRTTTTAYTPTLPSTPGSAEPMAGPLTQTKVTAPLNPGVVTVLDPGRGVPISVTDVAGHVTFADYDYLGRLTAAWKPGQVHGTDPATDTYSYVIASTGPSSVTTKTLVDDGAATGNLNYRTSITLLDSLGNAIQTQTDAVGGGSIVTDTFRDSHGWPIDTNNHWLATSAPSTGLVGGQPDANIKDRTETSYDGAGRPTLAIEYNGLTPTWQTRTVYGGNQTTVIPPTGGVVQTTVTDARNETTALKQYTSPPAVAGNIVTGTSQNTTYTYTALGQQNGMSSAGRTWSSTYDLGGRILSQTDPDTGTTTKTYDDLGEMLTSTDANSVLLTYTYDNLGRETGEFHGTVQTAAHQINGWLYDSVQAGKLTSTTHYTVSGTDNYTVATGSYDSAGNPMNTIVSLPSTETGFAASYTTSYTWSKTHLQLSVTPAAGGGLPTEVVKTTYDTFGDPSSVSGTNSYAGATYDGYGQPLQYLLGTNLQTTWLTNTWDPQTQRISEVNLSDQTAVPQVEDLQYHYDAFGNLVKSVDVQGNGASAPTETQCFDYTGLDLLSAAWSANDGCATDLGASGATNATVGGPQPYWSSWTFNSTGTRASQDQHAVGPTPGDKITSYVYSATGHADALSSTSGALVSSYTTDPAGNLKTRTLSGAALTVGYDLENRTASIAGASGTSTYLNDGNGNQLVRHDPASTTLYLPGEELTRTTSSGAITGARYYSIGGKIVSVRNEAVSTNVSFLLADPHGTNQTAMQTVGTGIGTITRRHFDPYGNALVAPTGTWPDQHAFLDKPADASSGTSTVAALDDIGAREYDPTTGRFLSTDPVLDPSSPQSLDGYSYASNNPISLSDPTGLRVDDPGSNQCDAACNHGVIAGDTHTYRNDPSTADELGDCNTPGGVRSCGNNSSGQNYGLDVLPKVHDADTAETIWITWATDTDTEARWNYTDTDGLACIGQLACRKAYDYIRSNPADLVGAKDIAGGYCIDSYKACNHFRAVSGAGQVLFGLIMAGYADGEDGDPEPSCGGESFAPDTTVTMADGSTKRLDQIRTGDKVEALDPVTGKLASRTVTKVWVDHDTDLMDVSVTSRGRTSIIHATQHHRFWDSTHQAWTEADQLSVGDQLLTDSGPLTTVARTALVKGAADMWDLTVDFDHDFYAGTGSISVLVHNCGIGHADIHQYPGIQASKSQFFDGQDLNALANAATGRGASLQRGRYTQYVVSGSDEVGVDRTTGLPTNTYTVIKTPTGQVVTMYPGTSRLG